MKRYYRTDDPVADADRYYREQEKALQKYPKCAHCDEHITDDRCYKIDGELLCKECMDELFSVSTDDYMK